MDDRNPRGLPNRGQPLFAVLLVALAAFLALSYPGQTTWVAGTGWAAQPGFWPALGVGGMALFAGLHLLRLDRRRLRPQDWAEAGRWLRAVEFAAWFLGYVFLVPRIGYLTASLLFVPAMTWRMGYRGRGWIGIAAGFAVVVVVLFKGLLEVRIPGGAIYDYLPVVLRAFFIQNL